MNHMIALAALLMLAAPVPGFAEDLDAAPASSACYAGGGSDAVQSLDANRDRLIADLAKRKSTDSCKLWVSLNKAERYIFLMDTAYFGSKQSRLHPPADGMLETALDHAVALYSINGPKAGQGNDHSGRGGMNFNRIFLGFDPFATCVMRNSAAANPKRDPEFNQWVKSDDTAGPHKPFTEREMVFWQTWLANSLGPQFHHWSKDSDFDQAGLDKRLGVCGVTDRSLTEATVAFDFFHNSNPLGNYSGKGGFGWQIVDKHVGLPVEWDYAPTGCAATPPVNDKMDGGGTFNGLGPAPHGLSCASPLNDLPDDD